MAMGPQNQREKIEVSKFDRIRHTVKQAGEAYFAKPLYYLFYSLLTATAVVLLFNHKLPWQFYLLLAILAGVEIRRAGESVIKNAKPKSTK